MLGITNYLNRFLPGSTAPANPPKDIFDICSNGKLEDLKTLHKGGIDLNQKNNDGDGWTPLHFACREGRLEVVKYLVENGSDVNQLTSPELEFSPLYLACHNSHYKIAEYLLEKGALPNIPIKNETATILHHQIPVKIAELLIKKGALLGARDAWGRTPLHNAESYKMAELLDWYGSQSSAKDEEGRIPLDTALAGKHYSAASALNYKEEPWQKVKIQERDAKGQLGETKTVYLYDNETADLYNLEPSALKFRAKSFVVIAAALPFAIKATFTNVVKIFSEASFRNLINRIYQAIVAPFYAIAMMFVGIVGLIDPTAGRKMMNKVESKWEETGLLDFAKMKKVGNLAESEINGYARYYLTKWNPKEPK